MDFKNIKNIELIALIVIYSYLPNVLFDYIILFK